mmetsp:Transcript_24923/g.64302  ORF Transcript_24923/g.64302 Transcript_24923/m.64302 type:complete len:360 (-) Transcript_24923:440-1519(-)
MRVTGSRMHAQWWPAGVLDPADVELGLDEDDPYAKDPEVHPALHMHSNQPLQAETPAELLLDSWITPNDLWFVRGHHPVPEISETEYKLTVRGRGLAEPREFTFTLEQLKTIFPKHEVVATLQCGGNGRRLFNELKKTMGIPWGAGAMSTARWGGARLSDVLRYCGLHDAERAGVEHVHFEGSESLTASIPVDKATSPSGDVLLAYEMNGEPVSARPCCAAHCGVAVGPQTAALLASGSMRSAAVTHAESGTVRTPADHDATLPIATSAAGAEGAWLSGARGRAWLRWSAQCQVAERGGHLGRGGEGALAARHCVQGLCAWRGELRKRRRRERAKCAGAAGDVGDCSAASGRRCRGRLG